MVIINDLEWPMLSLLCDLFKTFWKIMQQTEKEGLTKNA